MEGNTFLSLMFLRHAGADPGFSMGAQNTKIGGMSRGAQKKKCVNS